MKNRFDGGNAIVEAFHKLGVEYILSSPGTEWAPVWEAMADQIHRKKSSATPPVRAWTMEAERLLTLRESHRLTGIVRLPHQPAAAPGTAGIAASTVTA